jgi:hypothetical protein
LKNIFPKKSRDHTPSIKNSAQNIVDMKAAFFVKRAIEVKSSPADEYQSMNSGL